MRAVVIDKPGGPEVMRLGVVPDPQPADDEVLIRVCGAGVNRADVLQRMGFYPPPPGATETLGLEVSGVVDRAAASGAGPPQGARVMALIEGGGYAELVAAPANQVVTVPAPLDLVAAGGVPEVFITAHDNLMTRARLQPGESVLIHGGAGGVGTAAIQLAKRHGCRVLVTAGTADRVRRSLELGADVAINHRTEEFVTRVLEETAGGADVILDVIGAAYLDRNIAALGYDGRIVIIGMQGGTSAELNIAALNLKRGSVIATNLRRRPHEQKAQIVAAFSADVLPLLEGGSVRVVVDRVLPLAQAAEAHRALESGDIIGKVILQVSDG